MKKNILMLDDDLVPRELGVTEERMRLQTWLRWLKTGVQAQKFNLIETDSLDRFIAELKKYQASDPTNSQYIHALIIDVMWKAGTSTPETFTAINYPDDKVFPLEAGAQLLRFMLEPNSQVPDALASVKNRPIAVFSALPKVESSLGKLPKNVKVFRKTVMSQKGNRADNDEVLPSIDFQDWINTL